MICMMRPVGFPGNLLPHRCALTCHTSLKEGEEEGAGPADIVTLTPSLWPAWTTCHRCVEAAGRTVERRSEVSQGVRIGSRGFKVSGTGRS